MPPKTPARRLIEALAYTGMAAIAMALGGYIGSRFKAQAVGIVMGSAVALVATKVLVDADDASSLPST